MIARCFALLGYSDIMCLVPNVVKIDTPRIFAFGFCNCGIYRVNLWFFEFSPRIGGSDSLEMGVGLLQ